MKLWKKILLGLAVVIVGLAGVGTYFWFNRELPPISVAAPGLGGERVMLGDAPANYYQPSGSGSHPAILLLGGSDGSLREFRNIYARALAAKGYAVLYPGYYMTREGNRSFNMVPLETFDQALAWMKARPEIEANRIGIIGHSKGAEGALLIASRHPEIKAVVAAMPSDVVWQGFDFNSTDMSKFNSSWSEDGRPVPFVKYKLLSWYQWFSSDSLTRMFRQSWNQAATYPKAAISVDRMNAELLLICGGQDMIWPSCPMARAAKQRFDTGGMRSATLLAYPEAGHWAFGPTENLAPYDRALLGEVGGTAESDLAARLDQWPKILEFLGVALGRK
jgi:dienelactone hydrolase